MLCIELTLNLFYILYWACYIIIHRPKISKGVLGVSKKRKTKFSEIVRTAGRYSLLILYHITVGLYLRIAYNLRRTKDSDRLPKGPFVLLGNHCNNLDGLFLQCMMMRPVHFIITDTVFRKPWLGALLTWAGFIPKRKFTSDVVAVRQLIRAVDAGGVIGIFPEGMRSWDGRSVAIAPATFKLIKLLKVPVVTAHIMGSYLSGPRWANTSRRGRVEVKLTTLMDAQTMRSLSLADISSRISEALAHDEAVWQAEKHIPFRGERLAEGFERLLYICPECESIGTIVTHKRRIYCSACGAEYALDVYGNISSVRGKLPANNAAELNAWEFNQFKWYIARHTGDALIRDECARLSRSTVNIGSSDEIAVGTAILTRSALLVRNLFFPLSEITGTALNFKSGLMFRHGEFEYLLQFDNPRVSIHKWGCAFEIITGNPVG